MTGKPVVAFSFSKKAEPKRVVLALAKKEEDRREIITAVEAGQITLDGPAQAEKLLTIPCKNPLESHLPARPTARVQEQKKPTKPHKEEEAPRAGLISPNLSALSAEDAEATRELLKDAGSANDGTAKGSVGPILMREGSKRVREASAPDASKEMFENVPVEAFGEALLRGMGYDPDKHTTKPVFHSKPRDTLLGLGAQPLLPSEKAMLRGGGRGKAAATAKAAAHPKAPADAPVESPAMATPVDGTTERGEKRRRGDEDASIWPSRGLVVRVVGAEARLKDFYGAEAVVLEADAAAQTCRIKARAGGQSHVLKDVLVASLQTRVGRDCRSVRVLRGAHRGAVADLLRRDVERSVAHIRIEGEELELPLDDVCQFMV